MSDELVGQSFLVDPVAPLIGPAPKIVEGLPISSPIEEKISQQLDETTLRSLRIIGKALNGEVDLGDTGQRMRLGLASSVLGAWSRWQQTQTARWALQMRTQEADTRSTTARLMDRTQ